ncbi:MAG: SDR family oxidoreductase [Proteobacteria bacterium]|nr:SDR family oxidoreductase [Pseudomonadota bacterium]
MAYFITGATGFIGRNLASELTSRGEPIYVLVRPGSRPRLERLLASCRERAKLIIPVEGDLQDERLGIAETDRRRLRGQIRHFFHLGALYDLGAAAADLERANVLGTRNALDCARDVQAGCFHLVSSIAAAGRYAGTFTEDMFAEAQGLDHPYFRTKHESEAMVRGTTHIPWRVYRPGMVVGHSATGEMDKVDGPYYLFRLIQKVRDALPSWLPLIGFEGGHVNLVPVDFVARALAHLAHVPGHDGGCFHLTDPRDRRIGDVINIFAKAAHAPMMNLRLDPQAIATLPALARAAGKTLEPWRRIGAQVLRELGVEPSLLTLLNYPTRFDARRAQQLLVAANIQVPPLEDYAWRLWDYWERQLDPDLTKPGDLAARVRGQKVLVTGGSSGIGRATARKLAQAGAHVLIVARDTSRLAAVREQLTSEGGNVDTYSCDLADPEACDAFVTRLLAEHGHVDVLINNAGHSIRRAIEHTYGRFHDYERLMRVNYFAAVRVTLGLLPAMVSHGGGHVIGISSIGALSNAARFAAYNASKAALEAFCRTAAAEFSDKGVRFTVVNMPLVRTPMVAPTKLYEQFPLIQPEEAADIVCQAITRRPQRLTSRLGLLAQLIEACAPGLGQAIMSENFRMFPESEAAGGSCAASRPSSEEMLALASLMHGVGR